MIAAAHGHAVGGGIAVLLNAGYVMCESACTLQHGNIPRGVCPLAEFSQTAVSRLGQTAAAAFYMTNVMLSAMDALSIGLVDAVCEGVCGTQERALVVAGQWANCGAPGLALMPAADASALVREALGHAECRLVLCGEARPSDVSAAIELEWCASAQRAARPSTAYHRGLGFVRTLREESGGHQTCALPGFDEARDQLSFSVAMLGHGDPGCMQLGVEPVGQGVDAMVEAARLRLCLRTRCCSLVQPMTQPLLCGSSAAVGFDARVGVAFIRLTGVSDEGGMAVQLAHAVSWVSALGPRARAIILAASRPVVRSSASRRTDEQMEHALRGLHALGVPILSGGDDNPSKAAVRSFADYLLLRRRRACVTLCCMVGAPACYWPVAFAEADARHAGWGGA